MSNEKADRLTDAELAFIRFHAVEPLPTIWQFKRAAEGNEAELHALKDLPTGKTVSRVLRVSSYKKIECFFDADYRLNEAGRLLVHVERLS